MCEPDVSRLRSRWVVNMATGMRMRGAGARSSFVRKMSGNTPAGRMHEIVERLSQALRELDSGQLDLAGLEQACADAQSLYERLVVLRHKAREGVRTAAPAGEASSTASPETEPKATSDMPPLRLETMPGTPPPRQTSLIDAIAETETPPPAPAKATPPEHVRGTSQPPRKPERTGPATSGRGGATLGDKLERAPIADLHKAIALSQKFWFVAELFGGHRDRYEQAVDAINALTSADEARAFIAAEVVAKAPRKPAEDALNAFNELVERRFK